MKHFLKDCITGKKAKFLTKVEIKFEGDDLLINFDARHSTFNSYSNKYNDDIFNGDVCEVFIDVGKKDHYFEIESTPDGTLFFAEIFNNGIDRKINYLINDCVFVKTAKNNGNYQIFFKIKYKSLSIDMNTARINLYRIETEGIEPNKNLFALFPTNKPLFHVPEKFKSIKSLI